MKLFKRDESADCNGAEMSFIIYARPSAMLPLPRWRRRIAHIANKYARDKIVSSGMRKSGNRQRFLILDRQGPKHRDLEASQPKLHLFDDDTSCASWIRALCNRTADHQIIRSISNRLCRICWSLVIVCWEAIGSNAGGRY